MSFFLVNPYSGEDFFGFFSVLFHRLFGLISGIPQEGFFSDELQFCVLLLLGLSLAFLGTFLVLKQMTMVANALSHTLLLGLVLAFLLLQSFFSLEAPFSSMKALWVAAFITGGVTTFLTELLSRKGRVHEDASIAFVFTTLFALGVLLVTLFTRNMHLGVEALMGNIDALNALDLQIVAGVSLVMVLFFTLFFRGFFVTAFDVEFSKGVGFPVKTFNYLLMILTAGVAISCFRAVGVLLFLAFLVGPVLIARMYTYRLKTVIILSFGISALSSLFSVALSRHVLTVYKLPLSTSGITVTFLFILYLIALVSLELKRAFRKKIRHLSTGIRKSV